tara:strand:+ start:193 stop:369 length:177 start_codon:yes stop_codon:yes gene_type:complete
MIHVYKSGGKWKTGNKEYTIKAISADDKAKYLADGWVSSLDEVKAKRKAKAKQDDNKE